MMNSNTVGVRDTGRKGKMVPKGNSQRYCYENGEQMLNREQKKEMRKQEKVSDARRVCKWLESTNTYKSWTSPL